MRSVKWALPLAFALIFAWVHGACACSVPVFRYALERWAADNYRISVLHKGPLTDAQRALVDRLVPDSPTGPKSANLRVQTIDLNDTSANAASSRDELLGRLNGTVPDVLPALVIEYPIDISPAWVGPFNDESVSQLVDSPARREIGRRLLKGETAVWVFLESGDKAADDAAYEVLKTQLALAGENIKLPEIDEQDVADGLVSIGIDQLRVAFSLLRVSRSDPAEKLFVEMLLGSEGTAPDSLRDPQLTHQTMAFPIFGRGRALYALVGKGINEETITTACKTLVGPCTCEVKDQNPGVDMLMSIAWNDLVESTIDIDKELPPLTGLANFTGEEKPIQVADANKPPEANSTPAGSARASATDAVPSKTQSSVGAPAAAQHSDERAATRVALGSQSEREVLASADRIIITTMLWVGAAVGVVIVLSFFLLRKG
jgi:hypothetical protein